MTGDRSRKPRYKRNLDAETARGRLARTLLDDRRTAFALLILREIAPRADPTERQLHRGGSQASHIDAALGQGAMSAVLAIVDQRQQKVERARAIRTHARCELAGSLYGLRERIGLFVGRCTRRLEKHFGAELALEKELGSLARMRNDGGEQVAAGRSLLSALGQLLGQPSKDQQIRLGMGRSHRVVRRGFSRAPGLGQVRGTKAQRETMLARSAGVDSGGGELKRRRRRAEKQGFWVRRARLPGAGSRPHGGPLKGWYWPC